MRIAIIVAASLGICVALGQAHAEQKVIKSPAEYNEYMTALKTADPAKKAAAMEDFIKHYPASIVKDDALAEAIAAYQAAGDVVHVESTATRILAVDPGNIRALAIVTALERTRGTKGDGAALAAMETHAAQGLRELGRWKVPEDMSKAAASALRNQMTGIFNGAAGFSALLRKDYAAARKAYLVALKAQHDDLQDVYQLGVSELQMSPLDPNGFWYVARAAHLAEKQHSDAAVQSITAYGKAKYKSFHGSEDGWDRIVAAAAKSAQPPRDFAKSIGGKPSTAELIVAAVRDNDPATLSFSDIELVLMYRDASPANKEAARKVWSMLQAKQKKGAVKLRIPATVIASGPEWVDVAVADDNIKSKTADMHVVLGKPVAQFAPGTAVYAQGFLYDYTSKPFRFLMKGDEIQPAK